MIKLCALLTVNHREMRFSYLLAAVLLGITLNVLLLLLHVPAELRELETYKTHVEENVQQLMQKNKELEALYYQLQDDESRLVLEGYRIGMVFPEDEIIQVYPRERDLSALSPGEILLMRRTESQQRVIIRSISLSFSLVVIFVLFALNSRSPLPSSRRNDEHEPSQNISYCILRASK